MINFWNSLKYQWRATIVRFIKIALIGAAVAVLPELTKYAQALNDPWLKTATVATIAAVLKWLKERNSPY